VAAAFKPVYPHDFNYLVIPVLDMPFVNLACHFQEAIKYINSVLISGGTVLVHCFAGVSRSATIVIAYLMQELGMTMTDAMNFTRRRRPIVCPNFGF
jgi:atypical dual specificity phosphatase